jgi:hypothetical protein
MPTSKKQLEKLNKVKKAKAEELSKQAASGSKSAKKKLKKLEKKIKWAAWLSTYFYFYSNTLLLAAGIKGMRINLGSDQFAWSGFMRREHTQPVCCRIRRRNVDYYASACG